MKPRQPSCTLARFVPSQMDVESVKREGFNQHGILVVAVEDQRLSWIERQIVKQLGERIYGQK
jgi:hypothetical protein